MLFPGGCKGCPICSTGRAWGGWRCGEQREAGERSSTTCAFDSRAYPCSHVTSVLPHEATAIRSSTLHQPPFLWLITQPTRPRIPLLGRSILTDAHASTRMEANQPPAEIGHHDLGKQMFVRLSVVAPSERYLRGRDKRLPRHQAAPPRRLEQPASPPSRPSRCSQPRPRSPPTYRPT